MRHTRSTLVRTASLLLALTAVAACGPPKSSYTIGLERATWGANESEKVENAPFETDRFRIYFGVDRSELSVQFENRSGETVHLHWEEATFTTPDGRTSGVVQVGGDDDIAPNSASRTVVQPDGVERETVVPSHNVRWTLFRGWVVDPYLPKLYRDGKQYDEEEIRLTLPITFGDPEDQSAVEYAFQFRIADVDEYERLLNDLVDGPRLGPPPGIR